MAIHNNEIASALERLADLLDIEDANPFRVRAYRNAARTVGGYSRSMADMVEHGEDLSKLPEIGKDLADKIKTMVETGKLPVLNEAESRTPPALSDLMKIEGLGPKRVKILYQHLDIHSLEDLKRAANKGKIRELEGFGKKTEAMIKQRVERYSGAEKRTKLLVAQEVASALIKYLKRSQGVKQITVAGSYRRRKETVGDLDILVSAKKGSTVMTRFVNYEEIIEVISQGKTRSTVRLQSGLQVDVRVVPQVSYGAALHYFTGAKAHNIAVRKLGVKQGYKINEYGVFEDDKRIAGKTEAEVYQAVGLPYIEPELRENRGEIEAARKGKLPQLITQDELCGDLHAHTKASDGHHSLRQMAEAAAQLGYQYLAITEHSHRVTVANGLDKTRVLKHIKEIDKLNAQLDDIQLLKSIEVDIMEDGSLDLPDDVLAQLDLTVCSVHYKFNLSRTQQTERILKAMDNPHFNILGHPSGRLINEREPYDVDLERLMQGAKERGCFVELNAHPDRLDLTDDACLLAKEIGLKVAISTDAHSTNDLDFMHFGIGQARRGWLTADDVINTRPLNQLKRLLRRD
ncbi:DNA polymerase III [Candidatus Tenderia electrophaga]|uniref:DNA polymerase beta n=1 Tax=Candidatus Tenderia electrophaga TaxID=1748243 RepID=A0A0S2TFE3_9GAMM|nr:DNA polymerase III [Candidatus Tenderia electrophaga]